MILPDVQAGSPDVSISLTKVGITEVKKLVEIARESKRPIILIPTFDIFVDLPSNRKGANLSRNLEVIDKVLEDAIKEPVYAIEDLCVDISKVLLLKHEYASRAEVSMRGEYMMKRRSPVTDMECQEVYDICADAVAMRDGLISKGIGARVTAMTACPCAQDIMKAQADHKLRKLGISQNKIKQFLEEMPMPTHNQRGIGTINIEFADHRNGENKRVSIESIIGIIEQSMSCQQFELLKRQDEEYVVSTAHKNPKFVEDCVRTMALNLVKTFPDLDDETMITIKQVNEESIHRHNAFAERIATFGELRKEVNGKAVARAKAQSPKPVAGRKKAKGIS